ncbi:hypothetical protein BCR34DRAFT_595405 [Clohesyomyces aquaticus]|uniref:BAH domain-containing protein n=1 Tax=Clohesyomyces aquaticus TaxID=1231657 RepID=A0A1Y2AAA4_9PLEO|nr:hypothetical protein BCR34DRAFT_595405 [Clohesyomyces aquaticus]
MPRSKRKPARGALTQPTASQASPTRADATTPQTSIRGDISPATPRSPEIQSRPKKLVDWNAWGRKSFTLRFPNSKDLAEEAERNGLSKTQLAIQQGDRRDCTFDPDGNPVQPNPFDGVVLSEVCYQPQPADYWWCTPRRDAMQLQDQHIRLGGYAYINADPSQDKTTDSRIQDWVGRVLEIRANDSLHVYVRVYWMYRPEDLATGRQSYHGEHELIASNHMDIVCATTIQGKADVLHWVEHQDQTEELDSDQLFWRQTLDVMANTMGAKKKKKGPILSTLPKHCIDNTPFNPDQILIQCSHCEIWLHGPCIEEQAIRDAYQSHNLAYPGEDEKDTDNQGSSSKAKKRKRGTATSVPNKRSREKGAARGPSPLLFSTKVVASPSGKTRLIIMDQRVGQNNKTWEAPLQCLSCHHDIESDEEEGSDITNVQSKSRDSRAASDSTASSSGLFVGASGANARSTAETGVDTTKGEDEDEEEDG